MENKAKRTLLEQTRSSTKNDLRTLTRGSGSARTSEARNTKSDDETEDEGGERWSTRDGVLHNAYNLGVNLGIRYFFKYKLVEANVYHVMVINFS
jgi:hypothetical protein